MSMKIIWLVFNFIIAIVLTIFNNAIFGILYLLSLVSIPIFRDGFLAVLKGFIKGDVTFKILFKEFNKPVGTTSLRAGIILLQMYFATSLVLGTLIKHKFNFINLYQIPGDCLGIVIGVIFIIYLVKGVAKFVS